MYQKSVPVQHFDCCSLLGQTLGNTEADPCLGPQKTLTPHPTLYRPLSPQTPTCVTSEKRAVR